MARVKLTAGRIRDFNCPAEVAQVFLWDVDAPGLAVRATPAGKRNPKGTKAYIFQGKLDGKDIRLTIGDTRNWDIDKAQAQARKLGTLIDQGIDPRTEKKSRIAEMRDEVIRNQTTFGDAVKDYVEHKRRAKDNLPLKQRTKDDYLGMIASGKLFENGNIGQAGALHGLVEKPIYAIDKNDIRKVYDLAIKRGERQAAYSMQVLRAVLNWHGIKVEGNPLGKDVAGKERIRIPQPKATAKPIPPERIGIWWHAVGQAINPVTRDYLRFLLLTGCRVSEPKNILISDCDMVAGRVTVRDTKNRTDHTILMSHQVAEIVERNLAGKRADATLFSLADGKKTIASVAKRSGTQFSAKDLRSTFASIAEELVSAYTLKRMINHATPGDVTGTHYVTKSDSMLKTGWQAVADFIESQAQKEVAVDAGVTSIPSALKPKSRSTS